MPESTEVCFRVVFGGGGGGVLLGSGGGRCWKTRMGGAHITDALMGKQRLRVGQPWPSSGEGEGTGPLGGDYSSACRGAGGLVTRKKAAGTVDGHGTGLNGL